MSKANSAQSVRIRILVLDTPPEVWFAVQRGKSDLLDPLDGQQEPLRFDFSLRLGSPLATGAVNFQGEFAQGPSSERFVYINSGTLAGQAGSPWTRRAKLKLASIPQEVVDAALSSGGVIEARVQGTMGDGGPVCASLKPHAVVWAVANDAA
ncbi:MAG: DUF5990 family protein [Comamonas sp.]|uniref:DUF5990 family protein n=1 Tax=Comamonas sp. TaxID=34028 RepID=UPI002648ABEC|nr:DUF5990 family protein [Comamonas sp.]MDN5504068.1 DUF5990 family protein [Comamonas sp.]MDN5536098.1 DUF5990 family protein [Comamonas sp.]